MKRKQFPDKTLKRLIRNDEKKLAHKRRVQARHAVGTAYHTRASREIETLEARIAGWKTQIGT